MKPHPIELRERIISAVDQQDSTVVEIAETYDVGERYVYKLLRLRRETGSVEPRPHGGGASGKLGEKQLLKLGDLVAQKPEATLEELRERLKKAERVEVSTSTISRALTAMELTLKKRRAGQRKQIQ